MAEWSKALRSGRSLFGGVGSNPTSVIFPFVFSGQLEKGGMHLTKKAWWNMSLRKTNYIPPQFHFKNIYSYATFYAYGSAWVSRAFQIEGWERENEYATVNMVGMKIDLRDLILTTEFSAFIFFGNQLYRKIKEKKRGITCTTVKGKRAVVEWRDVL